MEHFFIRILLWACTLAFALLLFKSEHVHHNAALVPMDSCCCWSIDCTCRVPSQVLPMSVTLKSPEMDCVRWALYAYESVVSLTLPSLRGGNRYFHVIC